MIEGVLADGEVCDGGGERGDVDELIMVEDGNASAPPRHQACTCVIVRKNQSIDLKEKEVWERGTKRDGGRMHLKQRLREMSGPRQ